MSKIYANVIALSIGIALFFALSVVGLIVGVGNEALVGSLLPLGATLTGGFLTVGMIFAQSEGRYPLFRLHKGVTPIDGNILGVFVAAGISLLATLGTAMPAFLAPDPELSFEIIQLMAQQDKVSSLSAILTGIGGAAIGVIATLAKREANVEDEEDAKLSPEDRPPQEASTASA